MSMHADPCLSLALRRADRVVSQLYGKHFGPTGLRGTQYSVLRAIGEDGCITARELCERLLIDQTTASRAIKLLLRDGFLDARESPVDRRERLLCLTDDGRQIYAEAHAAWERAQAELRARLGEETSRELLELAARISAIDERTASSGQQEPAPA